MIETWRPVVGYEGLYSVSSAGRARSDRSGRCLAPVLAGDGYETVRFSRDGRSIRYRLHRIVAEAFCGPPNVLHRHAAHLDGDKTNNAAANLKWVSPPENAFHKRLHGTHQSGEQHPRAKLTEANVVEIRASSATNMALARKFGVRDAAISKIRKGQRWNSNRPKAGRMTVTQELNQ